MSLRLKIGSGWIRVGALLLLLTGCAAENHREAEMLAARQVQDILSHLPLTSGGYTWLLVQRTGATINVTVTRSSRASVTASRDSFMQTFQRQLCRDPWVGYLLEKKVTYRILLQDEKRNATQEGRVDNAVCSRLS